MNKIHPYYDIIIIGGGISGLYVATTLAKKYPTYTICVLEKYKTWGGRCMTYAPKPYRASNTTGTCKSIGCSSDIHWESGAGRVHTSHKRTHALLKKYGLTTQAIPSEIGYKIDPKSDIVPNMFETALVPIFIQPLTRLSPQILEKHTIGQLLDKTLGEAQGARLASWFPYKSELSTMRADVALRSFLEGPMASNKHYSVVLEGFGELIARMTSSMPPNVTLLGRHSVMDVIPAGEYKTDITVLYNQNKSIRLRAGRACIMALHSTALRQITPFQTYAPLRNLKTTPLLRIYMIFPTKNLWFRGLGRVVFPSAPRYMIPMDESKGTIMISYTDDTDTKHYSDLIARYGDESVELKNAVMRNVRWWFPELSIPEPTYTKGHLWSVGASYWVPKMAKSAEEVAEKIRHPFPISMPGVYVCGESYSAYNQAWVEGALETAEKVVAEITK